MPPKPIVPLTPEQQQLAAQWTDLARKIARKHGVDVGVTLEAVCRAARGYDPARGWTMMAWASRILTNACIDELRKKKHVDLIAYDESLHGPAAGSADILGERESIPEPVKAWTPPPDPVERKPRRVGTSARSLRRRAAQQGEARPAGRPAVLDARAVYRVLVARPGISNRALADALGIHRNTLSVTKNGQLIRRLRVVASVRILVDATPAKTTAPATRPGVCPAPAQLRF